MKIYILTVKFFSKIIEFIKYNINREKYAFNIGVDCDFKTIKIFGKVSFGTEPWLIKLGKNVYITNDVTFLNHDGGTLLFRNEYPKLEKTLPIVIGDNVFIGTKTIILPGVTIGNNVVIGAGSVVSKNIPNNSVYAGNPIKFIKNIQDYKLKLISNSLELGHLKGKNKANALKKYYKINK